MNSKARALISQARALSAARKPAQGALNLSIRKARGEGGQYLVGADLDGRPFCRGRLYSTKTAATAAAAAALAAHARGEFRAL